MNTKDASISIIGDGGWGTTMAIHLANKKRSVVLWGAFAKYIEHMRQTRENEKFLPGFILPKNITLESNIEVAIDQSPTIVLAMPSKFFRSVLEQVKPFPTKTKTFVILTKGIENKTLMTMSQVLEDVLGKRTYTILSGPCISREVVQQTPTAVAVAGSTAKARTFTRELFNAPHFTVLESDDSIGVQLGGSLKNVIAIVAGMLDGLGYGSNTKSVLLSRGIAEIARLGRKMKAKQHTFLGLSGLGDLVTTSFSIHSRNHSCGVRLGKGDSLEKILKETDMVIEGAETAKSALALSKKFKIQMPIVKAVNDVLFKKKAPKSIIDALMHKGFINEKE
ncbi:MAG: glycerol-3-phosphate dehydrogenase (NAD(P)+) [Candidatus Omnitrophota bacterium]|jgi:glycerol-3-phosphate dehydrogenase (NAD(P)+)